MLDSLIAIHELQVSVDITTISELSDSLRELPGNDVVIHLYIVSRVRMHELQYLAGIPGTFEALANSVISNVV